MIGNLDHTVVTKLTGQDWILWASARGVVSLAGIVHGGRQEDKSREGSKGERVQAVGGHSVGRKGQRAGRQQGQPREQERARGIW